MTKRKKPDEEIGSATNIRFAKCKLNSVCFYGGLIREFEKMSQFYTALAVVATRFISFHVMGLIETGKQVPRLSHPSTFVERAIRACANVGKKKVCPDEEIRQSFAEFVSLFPEMQSCLCREGVNGVSRMIDNLKVEIPTSYENSVRRLYPFVKRWLKKEMEKIGEKKNFKTWFALLWNRISGRDTVALPDAAEKIFMKLSAHVPRDLKQVEQVVPFLKRLLELSEGDDKARLFDILPLASWKARLVPIDTTILNVVQSKVLRDKQEPRVGEIDVKNRLWEKAFSFRSVLHGGKQFDHRILTDGVSVCVQYKMCVKKSQGGCLSEVVPEKQTIYGVDPGRKNVFVAVKHDPGAVWPEKKLETVKLSGGQYYHMCGFKARTKKMADWVKKNPRIEQFIKSKKTSKVAQKENFIEYLKLFFPVLVDLLSFNSTKRVKNLSFTTYQKKQKALVCIAEMFDRGSILALGDGSRNATIGKKAASPTSKGIAGVLKRRRRVEMVDEFNTSKLCCGCSEPLAGALNQPKRVSYGVRRCFHKACSRSYIDRDINGAVNILRKFLWSIQTLDTGQGPADLQAFKRHRF